MPAGHATKECDLPDRPDATAQPEVPDRPDATAQRSVLPGGLRVVTEHVPGARSASIGLWVDVGSRDEIGAQAGAAHFLEHLLFKGTRRRSARQIAEEIDAVGGDLNAFTGKEHTCFYAHVLDTDLALGVDVVCDVVLDAVMDAADVELERDVVLSEIAGRDEDPEDLLADDFDALLLAGHPLAEPVVGTESSIGAMTRDVLAGFHGEHYRPERAVLAVAGNLTHAAVLDAASRGFSSRLTGTVDPVRRPSSPAGLGLPSARLTVREEDTEQAHVMLGVPALRRGDERWETQVVLSTVLGGGMSSRLFQQVREQRGLAYSVYSAASGYADLGSLAVYVGCAPERLGTTAGVVRDELADLAAHGITDAELVRARGQLRGELVLGLEETSARMSRLGRRELDHGSPTDVAETLARIDAVSSSDVATLARELFAGPCAAAVVGPYGDVDELPGELQEIVS